MDGYEQALELRVQFLQDRVLLLESSIEDGHQALRLALTDLEEERGYVEDLLTIIRSNGETKTRLRDLTQRKLQVRDMITHLPRPDTSKT